MSETSKGAALSWRFWKYILGTVALIGGLFFLQKAFNRTQFAYRFADNETSNQAKAVPLEESVVHVEWGKPARFGKTVSLKDVLAHPSGVVVNFWATWCPPCIEELPSLEMYHRQSKSKSDLPKLVLISTDDGLQPLQQLFESLDFKPSFELYLDRSGKLAEKMGSTKFPETYLISNGGNVLFKWIGPQDWLSAEVLEKLRVAAAGQPTGQNQLK